MTAAPRVRSYPLLTALRAGPFLLGCILSFWGYALCRGPLARFRRVLQIQWCRGCLWLLGLKVRTIGAPATDGVLLFVSNHVSYLDIPVLSRNIAGTFVAKTEVAGWPLFGYAARITGTVFINRIGNEAKAQRRELVSRLAGGERLILFPEGTSTDGSRVEPFKSALFSLAEDPGLRDRLVVQPVSLAYTRAHDGTPLIGPLRALYAWFGEGTLLPHISRVLGLRGGEVEVRLHPPIAAAAVANRKELARLAEAAVRAGVDASFRPLIAEAGGEPGVEAMPLPASAGPAEAIEPPAALSDPPRRAASA